MNHDFLILITKNKQNINFFTDINFDKKKLWMDIKKNSLLKTQFFFLK